MSADLIEGRRFGQSWRGYDPDEVKQFLAQVAAQVRALRQRCDTMDAARREAEDRALHPQLDEATLMSAVGEETAGILRSAHGAAAEISAKAEANAQAIVGSAQARADDLIAEAESLLAKRTAEAEAAASDIREAAQADAERVKQAAQNDAEAVAAQAASECQETVQAAQALREKILTDLARRRKLGSVQIEQLRAGRERLLDAYMVVRRTLDETTDELQRADAEARAAADAVGRQYAERAEETVDLRHEDTWDALSAFNETNASETRATPTGTAAGGLTASQASEAAVTAPAEVPKTTGEVLAPSAPGTYGLNAPVLGASALAAGVIDISSAAPTTISLLPSPPAPSATVPAGPAIGTAGPDDSVEGVRLVRSGTAATSPRSRGASAKGAAPAKGRRPVPDGTVPDGTVPDGTVPDGPGAGDDMTGAPLSHDTNGHDTNGHDTNGHDQDDQKDVQGLFARIRASRVEAANTARKTLYPADGAAPGVEDAGPAAAADGSGPSPAAAAAEEVAARPAGSTAGAEHEFFTRRDAVTKRLESSLARKLKRALQDEQNSLLDRLRNLKVAAVPANVLPSLDEHPDRFVDAGRPLLEEAARAGADLVANLWGNPGPSNLGRSAVEDLAEEMGRTIAEPLRQRLELAFQTNDGDNVELAEALGAAYREWKTQRIEAVARDQVAAAFSRGSYLAFPDGAALRWVAGGQEELCPDCEDNALAGEQAKSEPWPTGQLYPPAHPGCRCALAPAASAPTAGAREPAEDPVTVPG
jgi:DivIVA domain-containing protein